MYSSEIPARSLAAPAGLAAPPRARRPEAPIAAPDPDAQIERAERFGHHYGALAPAPQPSLPAPRGGQPIQAQLRRRRPTPPEESEREAPRRPPGIGSYLQSQARNQISNARSNPGPLVESGATFGASEIASGLFHSNPITAAVSIPSTAKAVKGDVGRLVAEVGNQEYGNAAATGFGALTRIGGLIGGAFGLTGSGAVASGARLAVNSLKTHAKTESDEAPPSSALENLQESARPLVEGAKSKLSDLQFAARKKKKEFQGKQD